MSGRGGRADGLKWERTAKGGKAHGRGPRRGGHSIIIGWIDGRDEPAGHSRSIFFEGMKLA